MRDTEIARDRSRQGRLARQTQCGPDELQNASDSNCRVDGETPLDGRQSQSGDQGLQPFAENNGLVIVDEVGTAGAGGIEGQTVGGLNMGCGRVVDIGETDPVGAVPDQSQPAFRRAVDDARNEVRVSGTVDEMGSQRDGGQCFRIRFERKPFRGGLGRRVMAGRGIRIGQGGGAVGLIAPIEDHRR